MVKHVEALILAEILVVASLEYGATTFVTNDTQLRRVRELAVIVLGDHVSE